MHLYFTEQEQIEYNTLCKIKDKFINQLNGFIRLKKGNFFKGIEGLETPEEKLKHLVDKVSDYAKGVRYVIDEYKKYLDVLMEMFIEEITAKEFENFNHNIIKMVHSEFVHYHHGIFFSIQNELI